MTLNDCWPSSKLTGCSPIIAIGSPRPSVSHSFLHERKFTYDSQTPANRPPEDGCRDRPPCRSERYGNLNDATHRNSTDPMARVPRVPCGYKGACASATLAVGR